jgi:HK97 family phage major capsid protein
MSSSVLSREFERLAERNAQLLHTDAGEGQTIEASKALSDEFETNLTRLTELKGLLEKERDFDELQKWAGTPERRAAVTDTREVKSQSDGPKIPQSLTDELLSGANFKAWLAGVAPTGVISDNAGVQSPQFNVKNLAKTVITGADAGSGGAFVQRDYTNLYVPFIQPQLTVRDLVINATTGSDIVEYTRAVAHTNAAAETAEATDALDGAISGATPGPYTVAAASGVKPEGAFTWVKVTAGVETIAEGVPATRRALSDAGQLRSILEDQLRYDLAQRLNTQMISGNGTSPNLRGIRNTTGILTQAFSNNVIETLRKGKTKVSDTSTGSGKIPNGAVLTPTSLETLDLFRVGGSTTTDGPFLINPFSEAPRTLWGMRLVEEPGMTASKAVVGYFRDAVLWDREQETVQFFDQHKDFAARNLVYVLGEWRGVFGVLQPKSFVDCTMA